MKSVVPTTAFSGAGQLISPALIPSGSVHCMVVGIPASPPLRQYVCHRGCIFISTPAHTVWPERTESADNSSRVSVCAWANAGTQKLIANKAANNRFIRDKSISTYSTVVKKSSHLRLHRFIHFTKRRPFALETFARQFLCRVDAHFCADGEFGCRVIQHIRRAARENGVALRICRRA